MRKRRLLLGSLLVLVACASYEPSLAPTKATTGRVFAARETALPIENVAKVDEGVWRGAAPDVEGLRALKKAGFRTIVDLQTTPSYCDVALGLGLRVVRIPMRADLTSDPPTQAQVRRFLDVVTNRENQPVYVHCTQGRDRTGTMCALYRMEVCGWTTAEAIEEMHAFGYHDWYQSLIDYVRGYQSCGAYAPATAPAPAR